MPAFTNLMVAVFLHDRPLLARCCVASLMGWLPEVNGALLYQDGNDSELSQWADWTGLAYHCEPQSPGIGRMRQLAVADFLRSSADALLMCDSDILVGNGAVAMLVEVMKRLWASGQKCGMLAGANARAPARNDDGLQVDWHHGGEAF